MNKFPTIKTLSDLLPYIEGNPQIRVAEQPNGTTVACYMLQDEDTFAGENEAWLKECRGITFYADGTIASRALNKFFNVGESEETQPHNIPWDKITRITDKRDGSMIGTVLIDGKVVCKTKKTFTSPEAIAATEFIYAKPERVEWVMKLLQAGFSPTFEWTSPRFPIVLTYEKDELTLLQIRENVTGRYITNLGEGGKYTQACPFPVIENLRDRFGDAREVLELAKTTEGVEGWIIQTDDGDIWKVKTAWYTQLHRAVSFVRWRDIARAVVADESDDLKAAFAMTGRSTEPIKQVEHVINSALLETEKAVQAAVNEGLTSGKDAKTMALTYKGHPLFGLIMTAFRGKAVDYREWYQKNRLDDEWSLEVVTTAL